jgi:hypothetical protein
LRHHFVASARLLPPVSHLHSSTVVSRRAKSFTSPQHSIARAARDTVNRFKFSLAAQRLTLELTRRETTTSCGKLTMKDKLIPVGLNELLGRPCDVSIQCMHRFCLLHDIQFNCYVNAKRPNARINPPGDI